MNSITSDPIAVIVMGVSGCGKSTVGSLLAARLGVDFIEGDEFHPSENVAKMASGQALTDEDRKGWLQTLSDQLKQAQVNRKSVVLSCSALKESYREILKRGSPKAWIIYLNSSFEVLNERVTQRSHQYMPASLLKSQLATLEPPAPGPRVLSFDVATPAEQIAEQIQDLLRAEK